LATHTTVSGALV
jgi:hypothetical protein